MPYSINTSNKTCVHTCIDLLVIRLVFDYYHTNTHTKFKEKNVSQHILMGFVCLLSMSLLAWSRTHRQIINMSWEMRWDKHLLIIETIYLSRLVLATVWLAGNVLPFLLLLSFKKNDVFKRSYVALEIKRSIKKYK